jgi:hypothetical protein
MPGIATLGKLFFNFFFRKDLGLPTTCLVVRRIIRRKLLRRGREFVARLGHRIAAAATRSEFVLTFGPGCDDHLAA